MVTLPTHLCGGDRWRGVSSPHAARLFTTTLAVPSLKCSSPPRVQGGIRPNTSSAKSQATYGTSKAQNASSRLSSSPCFSSCEHPMMAVACSLSTSESSYSRLTIGKRSALRTTPSSREALGGRTDCTSSSLGESSADSGNGGVSSETRRTVNSVWMSTSKVLLIAESAEKAWDRDPSGMVVDTSDSASGLDRSFSRSSGAPSVPETRSAATVHHGSGSAVTSSSSSSPVNAKEAPSLANTMPGEVVARNPLIEEGLTGEEKPAHDVGCEQASCANRYKASEDLVVGGTSEATHSRLCVGVSTLVRTDSTGSTHDTAHVCPARELATAWHTSNDGADGPRPHVELEASEG
mmetsp:Transcript_10673/g.29625  ORF Transcript_10673/g.29625 Transcript_10673/m.29625 type:complete len:350 (-) Transcript_10673:4923-5972(-)